LKIRQTDWRGIAHKRCLWILGSLFFLVTSNYAIPIYKPIHDSASISSQKQAIEFINKIIKLEPSAFWPNIKPVLFLQNIKTNIQQPGSIYPGNGTNFCAYGALTYLILQDDPLGYTKLLLQLYNEGKATYRNISFEPSNAIKKAAGMLRYKGILDIHPAEQMWYLCLADHFKGYLNIFNRKYDPDDEDKLWASVNYAKFNRMLKKLSFYQVKTKGADLFRPKVGDLFQYISEKMETGTVVLFINNRIMHKKNHARIKLGVPTHFIVAEKISKENDAITFVYWDYGGKTQLQISQNFFKRIVFGITACTKNEKHAD
jgi:hypothetical protein